MSVFATVLGDFEGCVRGSKQGFLSVILGRTIGRTKPYELAKDIPIYSQIVPHSPIFSMTFFLSLRSFGSVWKFIMFLKLVILILLQKKENQRHSQSITEFQVWSVGKRVRN